MQSAKPVSKFCVLLNLSYDADRERVPGIFLQLPFLQDLDARTHLHQNSQFAGTPLATFQDMTTFDGLIIYFAFAAPFAVYHFIQSRKVPTQHIWLETIFNFIFWLPLAALIGIKALIKAVHGTVFANVSKSDAEIEQKVQQIYQSIKGELRTSGRPQSIHEFREVFDRYAGLTIVAKNEAADTNKELNELFAINDHSNLDLAATCLNRRNRNRIRRHQAKARIDFLAFVAEHAGTGSENIMVADHAIKLAELLEDTQATNALRAEVTRRCVITDNVLDAEKEVWMSEAPKPSNVERISVT